ncbi:MAG: nucleotide exchange factor GrpE [Verrucomicrobiales bacterium]|nr:nucleotide exchange factor GrpE [Verrucomicrobiales bacterium]
MSEGKPKKARKDSQSKSLPVPVPVPKWPFLFCNILFLALAGWLGMQIKGAVEPWQIGCIMAAVVFGALFAAAPFFWEYRAEAKAVEVAQLTTVAKEVNKMELVAKQMVECTGNWTQAQEASSQSVAAAKDIAEQIGTDAKEFTESMAALNDSKLKTLELEVDKLKRAEREWGLIVIGQLDLVYRLKESAILSGKEQFIETMTTFQNQCRDIARRVGLTAYEADAGSAFNPEEHQLADVDAKPGKNAKVGTTKLPGFKLQGQLIRKAVVTLTD